MNSYSQSHRALEIGVYVATVLQASKSATLSDVSGLMMMIGTSIK